MAVSHEIQPKLGSVNTLGHKKFKSVSIGGGLASIGGGLVSIVAMLRIVAATETPIYQGFWRLGYLLTIVLTVYTIRNLYG